MPTYTYECKDGHRFEAVQRITDKPLNKCTECKKAAKRIIVAANFHLKGEKWFKNSGEY